MDAFEMLTGRRSCRAYTAEPVAESDIEKVVEAGTFAPSGMGRQPWHFIVVTNPDDVAELSRMNARIMVSSGDPFYGAGTVVVVLVDPDVPTCVEDGSLAIGNMLNAAHALGLGSCWIHRAFEEFDSPEGKALLRKWGVAGDWRGVGHVILGHAAKPAGEAAPRKEGLVTRVR